MKKEEAAVDKAARVNILIFTRALFMKFCMKESQLRAQAYECESAAHQRWSVEDPLGFIFDFLCLEARTLYRCTNRLRAVCIHSLPRWRNTDIEAVASISISTYVGCVAVNRADSRSLLLLSPG